MQRCKTRWVGGALERDQSLPWWPLERDVRDVGCTCTLRTTWFTFLWQKCESCQTWAHNGERVRTYHITLAWTEVIHVKLFFIFCSLSASPKRPKSSEAISQAALPNPGRLIICKTEMSQYHNHNHNITITISQYKDIKTSLQITISQYHITSLPTTLIYKTTT